MMARHGWTVRLLRDLVEGIRSLLRRSRLDRELERELRDFRDRAVERHRATGLTAAAASRAAALELGSVSAVKDHVRGVGWESAVESIWKDITFALRGMARAPAFNAAVVLSLALGVGANTAIFSLVDPLLLRALPVAQPQRLALLSGDASPNKLWTFAIWDQVRQHSQPFAAACAWGAPGPGVLRFDLADGGEMQPIEGVFASGGYFATLGVPALIGRTFTAADDARGGGPDGPVAVISYAFWQRHFNGAADIAGRTIRLNRVPFTIIGVTPAGFFGAEVGRTFDVTVPIGTEIVMRGRDSYTDHRTAFWLNIMLRPEPHQSIDTATSALRAAQPAIREGAMPPNGRSAFLRHPLSLSPATSGASDIRERYQRPLLVLFVVVLLVLLVACANVAHLLLARARARRHEFTVRLALGAGRSRLMQQLVVENLLLSTLGAAGGLVFAIWGSRALVARLSTGESRVFLDLSIDWRVLAFTAAVAVATTALFGAAPMLHGARASPIGALRDHGRGSEREGRLGFSSALVVGQVALSLVLVIAAGLFVRTFQELATLPRGFDTNGVLVINVDASRARTDRARRLDVYQSLADAASAVPGVASAAASATTPLNGRVWGGNRVEVSGAVRLPESESTALVNFVTPGWFSTYRTPLVAGRDVDRRDTAAAPLVTVVNEAFVKRFLPGKSALGETVTQFPDKTTRTIVGVVGDALYSSAREPIAPTMYVPLLQFDWSILAFSSVSLSVRAHSGAPSLLTPAVAAELTKLDRGLSFTSVSLADQVSASLARERLVAALSGMFGALALGLAGLGLFGVTSYAVTRRRSELGIRMALGAAPASVVRLVMSRMFGLVTAGLALGAAVSLWASRFVATLLYGLEPRDATTFFIAAIVLASTGALAAWLPAWRASRIDPASVLREN
jgi:predicted permease